MKTEIEQLIDRFATGAHKCPCMCNDCIECTAEGTTKAPVRIGDVLGKIWQKGGNVHFAGEECERLCNRWRWVGFTKSLQEILAEVDWGYDEVKKYGEIVFTTVPKQNTHRELFTFLLSLEL